MAKVVSSFSFIKQNRRKRPGIHAKTKVSRLKTSKHYRKTYRGQGRA